MRQSGADLTISRARLRATGATRLALERGLDRISLDGLGLGPDDIFYVPKLTARAPLRPGHYRDFGREVGRDLRDLLEVAARDPVAGQGGHGPLRFSSRPAFVAWLAGALLTRPSVATDVLRAVTGHHCAEQWRRQELLGDGRLLIATLARLSEVGLATAWVSQLEPQDVAQARAAITRSYGVDWPESDPARHLDDDQPGEQNDQSVASEDTPTSRRPQRGPQPPALLDMLGRMDTLDALPVAAIELMLAARLLTSAPGMARSAIPAMITVGLAIAQGRVKSAEPEVTHPAAPVQASVEQEPRGAAAPHQPTPRAQPAIAQEGHRGPPSPLAAQRQVQPDQTPALHGPEAMNRRANVAGAAPRVAAVPVANAGPVPLGAHGHDAAPQGQPDPAPRGRTGIVTSHGGLFFLINALTVLELYGDFSQPLLALPGLSPFGLLHMLGKRWFGRDFEGDPLAGLLVELDGTGSAARIGRDFDPPDWQVPLLWLEPWSVGPTRQRVTRRRAAVWHKAGFPITDQGREATALPERRRRWVGNLARYLEARTARAMGVQGRRQGIDLLCRHDANIDVEPGRIEVRFDLAAHPLPIRIAGLDRDIGWFPAAGFDIRFRFS